jgi:outer membrane receptor protein involved in Fe transport
MRFLAVALIVSSLARAQKPAELPPVHTTVVIKSTAVEPEVDRHDDELFSRTLFGRDDQLLHVLGAGINAGQHEGGGKSLEIRRFGFNLDHGGVNGGLKVLVDNVQQNQTTQGHGQGYLGSLKSLSPELVQEATIVNGPFSPEYGDFSGLGVVHIRTRESMPDVLTARFQRGSFDSVRGFMAWSPPVREGDALVAYEGSNTEGPFLQPLGYRRDNVSASFMKRRVASTYGFKFNGGTNNFTSSGQLPLDEIEAGRLDRFGSLDPTQGGRVSAGTISGYFRRDGARGGVLKADAFLTRSLLDLFSNFTYLLNDPVNGDGIQQHDSRLIEGANVQYLRPYHGPGGLTGLFTAGGNVHDNQINVGLYSRAGRAPVDTRSLANAHVSNGAGFFQNTVSLLSGRLTMSGGLRCDAFRFSVEDRVDRRAGGTETASRWQPKAAVALTPSHRVPLTLHANYGRGISTADARVVVQRPESTRVATTDFYQAGTSHRIGRWSASTDVFLIDRSNELVYLADDGTFELSGPSRAYGVEAKTSMEVNRFLSIHIGGTKVLNALYRGTLPREYVTNAPHLTVSGGITVAGWRGWSGSLRMRAISRYRLDGFDESVRAAGHTVWDLGVGRRLRRGLELSVAVDNLTGKRYYETQNYYESRLAGQGPMARIHATPGYPIGVTAGLTWRFGGK